MAKVLIACYSRTGYTASLAREMAAMTGWDLEEISDLHSRLGGWGFLRCLFDTVLHRRPGIRTTGKDPGSYDVVVLAAPVWARHLSAPMRSYIARHRPEFNSLAFACTYGGRGAENATREAAAIAGKPLKASLAVTAQELDQENHRAKLDAFLGRIRQG